MSGVMAALFAAMLVFDRRPLPYQAPVFRARFNRNAYYLSPAPADGWGVGCDDGAPVTPLMFSRQIAAQR
jgi:hypothetical protein